MNALEPAMGKKELKEVFMEISDKIENGFVTNLRKDFKYGLIKSVKYNSKVLRPKDLDYLNDRTILKWKIGTRVTSYKDGIWRLKNSKGKEFKIKENDDKLELYSSDGISGLKMTMKEMKGIILEEIYRKDPAIIVKDRNAMIFKTDSPEHLNKEFGDRKMANKRKRRMKKYKKRVDKLIKKTGVL